ncbi:hypothetical protein CPB86DRAFT_791859 [Serendipita vermifera]|nr:hypothetical protein CPB86DRAFT_791859 [Serendipita vermifera]
MRHNDKRSRLLGLVGLGFTVFMGSLIILLGILGLTIDNELQECQSHRDAQIWGLSQDNSLRGYGCFKTSNSSVILFFLNVLITICTDAVGYVHGATLRWTLARENRLEFSTNLRLYSASRKIISPNGYIANIIMLVTLGMSYSSAAFITMTAKIKAEDIISTVATKDFEAITPSYAALLILGSCFLIQALISIAALHETHVKTWNTNCLATAEALMDQGLEIQAGNCMRSVGDDRESGPLLPLRRQISAWSAHPQVRWVLLGCWFPVIFCATTAGVGTHIWRMSYGWSASLGGWSIVHPDAWSRYLPRSSWIIWWNHTNTSTSGLYALSLFAVMPAQLPIIIGLHCAELIVTLYRDEEQWRVASTARGTQKDTDSVRNVLYSLPSLFLFFCKPALNWLFGQALSTSPSIWIHFPIQTFNLTGGFLLFTLFITYLAVRRPNGPQPCAYGHCQTLVNLIDEWHPKMYWGHKSPIKEEEEEGENGVGEGGPGEGAAGEGGEGEVEVICHAGTSSQPLKHIQIDKRYAGRS